MQVVDTPSPGIRASSQSAARGSSGQGATFFAPLESLRGVAALVVVIYHAVWTNPVTQLRFFQNGALMVDFFFVLSGFVIYHSYGLRLANLRDLGRFLWLRLGRLYPLHLAFLLVFLAFEVAKLYAQEHFGIVADKPAFTVNDTHALMTNLLLIHSLGLEHSITFNYPSWSISTEFYAYVLFAAVRSVLRTTARFAIAAVVIVAGSIGVLHAAHLPSLVSAGYDWGFFRCSAGFFLGTLTCIAYRNLRKIPARVETWERPLRACLSPIALLSIGVLTINADPNGKATFLMPALSAFLILAIVLIPSPAIISLLCLKPLRWLGKVSYSVYMSHAAVVWVLTQILTVVLKFPKTVLADGHGVATPPLAGLLVLLIYICLVLPLSAITFRFIEEPFRIRSRQIAARWNAESTAAPAPVAS